MSMEGAIPAPAASTPAPASASQIDPVHTAWPRMRNPGEGTLAGHQPGPSSRVTPVKPATSVTDTKATSQPQAGPSPSKSSPLVQTSIPENSDRPSLAKTLMPEGETREFERNNFLAFRFSLRSWPQTRRTVICWCSIRKPSNREAGNLWGGLHSAKDGRSRGDQEAEDGIPRQTAEVTSKWAESVNSEQICERLMEYGINY